MHIFSPHVSHHPALRQGVRAWVWALLALLLLATLAPAISRTLDHGKPLQQRGWLEVCSAQGQAWVQTGVAGDAQTPTAPDLAHHLDACAYCALGTDRGTPPPNFDGWGRTPQFAPPCPVWAGHPPRTAAVRTAQARGPPALTRTSWSAPHRWVGAPRFSLAGVCPCLPFLLASMPMPSLPMP